MNENPNSEIRKNRNTSVTAAIAHPLAYISWTFCISFFLPVHFGGCSGELSDENSGKRSSVEKEVSPVGKTNDVVGESNGGSHENSVSLGTSGSHPLWSSEAQEGWDRNDSVVKKGSLRDRLRRASTGDEIDADEAMLIIVKYARDKNNFDEIKRLLTEKTVQRIEGFDYRSIDSGSLKHIVDTFRDQLGYDLDLPDSPDDYTFSQKIALYYCENLFENPNR